MITKVNDDGKVDIELECGGAIEGMDPEPEWLVTHWSHSWDDDIANSFAVGTKVRVNIEGIEGLEWCIDETEDADNESNAADWVNGVIIDVDYGVGDGYDTTIDIELEDGSKITGMDPDGK